MNDPRTAQGVARMFPGGLGGRVVTSVDPLKRRPIRRRHTCYVHLTDGYAPNYFYPVGVDDYGDALGAALDDNGKWYSFMNPSASAEGHLWSFAFPALADTDTHTVEFSWATFDYRWWPAVETDGSVIYSILNETSVEALTLPGGSRTTLHTAAAGTNLRGLVLVGSRLYFGEVHDLSGDPDWTSELRYVTTSGASGGVLHSASASGYPRKPIDGNGLVTTPDGAVWGRIRQVDEVGFSHPVSFDLFRYDTIGASYLEKANIGTGDLFARPDNEVSWGSAPQKRANSLLAVRDDECNNDIGNAGTFSFAHDSTFSRVGLARFTPEQVWGLTP